MTGHAAEGENKKQKIKPAPENREVEITRRFPGPDIFW